MNITVLPAVHLGTEQCTIDGKEYAVSLGTWSFYIPALNLKILHAINGATHCTHKSAPPRDQLFAGLPVSVKSSYTADDWKRALSKSPLQRATENYVAAKRLHAVGIGPEAQGICVIRQFSSWYTEAPSMTGGFYVADLSAYPPKENTTVEQMIAAGVRPDRILSCVRQQINGYVSDLNSVVGVMPEDADDEIGDIARKIEEALQTEFIYKGSTSS